MIASTSTCWRRTSSWRITSPKVRWTSGVAEMTIALAPSKRVTTALRAPTGRVAAGRRGRRGGGRRRRRRRAARAGRRRVAALARAAPPRALRRRPPGSAPGRAPAAAPAAIARHRHAGGRRPGSRCRSRRAGRAPAAMPISCATAAPSPRKAIALELSTGTTDTPSGASSAKRRGDLARAGIVEADDPGHAAVDVDPGQHLADPGDIVGEVGDDDRAAAGGDRAVAADQRPQRLDRRRRLDMADPEDLGDEAARRRAPAADRRGRGRARDRLDAEARRPRSAPRRSRWRASSRGTVRNIRRRQAAAAVTTETRPCTRGIDDEGAPGHPRRVLDEGADVGVAQVEHMLRAERRQAARRASARASNSSFHGFNLTRSGTARPPRSTMTLTSPPRLADRRARLLERGDALAVDRDDHVARLRSRRRGRPGRRRRRG